MVVSSFFAVFAAAAASVNEQQLIGTQVWDCVAAALPCVSQVFFLLRLCGQSWATWCVCPRRNAVLQMARAGILASLSECPETGLRKRCTPFDNTRHIRAMQSAVDVSLDAFEFINVRIRQAVLVAVDQGCMQSARSLCKWIPLFCRLNLLRSHTQ